MGMEIYVVKINLLTKREKELIKPLLYDLSQIKRYINGGKLKPIITRLSPYIVPLKGLKEEYFLKICRGPFWQKVYSDRELFESLPPIEAVSYREGVLVLDGIHRSVIHLLTEFKLKINILDQ
jgi:hypothetical protein